MGHRLYKLNNLILYARPFSSAQEHAGILAASMLNQLGQELVTILGDVAFVPGWASKF